MLQVRATGIEEEDEEEEEEEGVQGNTVSWVDGLVGFSSFILH
jgi:hypothetical protein